MSTAFLAVHESLLQARAFPAVPRVHARMPFVLFRRTNDDDVLFFATGHVTEAEPIAEFGPAGERQVVGQKVYLSSPVELPKPALLSVVAGSLRKVTRFEHPSRHFQRALVAFQDKADLPVFTEGRLYMHRSVFRYFFSALPMSIQAEFVSRLSQHNQGALSGRIASYSTVSTEIIDFLAQDVLPLLLLLTDLANAHRLLEQAQVANQRPLNDLKLYDDEMQTLIKIGYSAGIASSLFGGVDMAVEQADPMGLSEARRHLAEAEEYEEDRTWHEPIFLNSSA